ncbi:MAG: type II toxin-antitoxin system RelE/ParE family toxin [Sphingorhabdus sp.]
MKHIIVSPSAETDLIEISQFIRYDNPARAISFIEEIFARFALIAERPKSFPAKDDVFSGLRSCLHGKYLILFVEYETHVRIVRIVHGSRHLGRLFLDGQS